jgi:D-3-phosphoglycerate dehydrogenase / 2-oxoglutarate reductase
VKRDRPKVVVTDYDFPSLALIRDGLKVINAEFIAAQCQTSEQVIELCREADAVITEHYKPFDRNIISRMQRCQVIVRTGIGFDTVDLPAATDHGIYVVNIPAYSLDEVSDHALTLLLASVRKVPLLNNSVRRGEWDFKISQPVPRLRGRTLGIVGYGRIGQKLQPKAAALGLKVIAYDPYDDPRAPPKNVPSASFETLLSDSDFISIHAPLTPETRGMFDEAAFRKMKRTAYLINTSRGPIVRLEALYQALIQGWIGGAGMDVLETEPIDPSHPILKLDNFVVTPHCAWYSEGAMDELLRTVAEEVVRALQGQRPLSVVNPEVDSKARATSPDWLLVNG